MDIHYFDHAATTAVREEVIKEMIPYFGLEYGNPSSLYGLGRSAKRALEESRRRVSTVIGACPHEIYFTSCGSESDNLAIKGVAYANMHKGKHIITSKIEHHAVLNTCKSLEKQGFTITYINVDEDGVIDLEELSRSITPQTILISIMFANNEIGTIEPISQIGQIAKKHNIPFHTDAVQAIGNIKIDVNQLNIDLLSMSAHKFYGPKGVGALFVRDTIQFEKIQDGGHQEHNKRAGTENVAQIVGMAKALELIDKEYYDNQDKMKQLRDYFIYQVKNKIPYIQLNGSITNRLPGNANISFEFLEGEDLLLKLDEKNICASSGSACSSGSPEPSHVLMAIGKSAPMARGALRISLGKENTLQDIDYLVQSLSQAVGELRSSSPTYQKRIEENFSKKM